MRTIFLALLGLCLHTSATAQSCLPNGITFNTQAQINSFHANYPGCTSIAGNVIIDPQPSGNITNLNGLSGLTFIGGDLTIAHSSSLNNLSGLSSLDSIGGSLSIFNTWGLNSLSALGALKAIHGNFIFYDNHGFTNLNSLTTLSEVRGNVDIYVNPLLNNLNGLNALTNIGGSLRIADNVAMSNLSGLNGLKTVGGGVTIGGSTWQTNAALTSLAGLDNLKTVGGSFAVSNNPVLPNLNGLGSLTTVGNWLNISDNPLMHNLTGLENLVSAPGLNVYKNQNLENLVGLSSLNPVPDILIQSNPMLTSLSGLEQFTVFEGLTITNNTALASLDALQNATALNKGIYISGSPAITNLSALSGVVSIGSGIHLEDMDGLINLNGLGNIQVANNINLNVNGCAALSTLNGLSPNITSLGGLDVFNNALLTDLQGLENIATVENGLRIGQNPALVNLNGLQNVTTTKYLTVSGNPLLTDLNGLDKLATLQGLAIEGNSNLVNLAGMTSLNALGGLYSAYNPSLKNFVGLENTTITGNVEIYENATLENLNGFQGSTTFGYVYVYSNASLTSLAGMENVTKIFDGLRINNNPLLTDLSALNNLKTLRHDLYVTGNQSLSDCAVIAFCLFLSDPPQPDSVGFGSNAPGCNSNAEVSSLCTSSAVTVEVLVDSNASCSSGLPVEDFPVRLVGNVQTTLKPTAADGRAKFRYFDPSPFQVILPQLSDQHWNVCEVRQVFVASNGGDSTHVFLYLSPKIQCPALEVKLNLPTNFRGCLVQSELQASAQNIGTVLAEGGKMAVVMPPVFELLNTDPLMSGQNGDTLYFEVGDLKPFEKALVKVTVKTKCDTILMGQTLCWEAFAAMDNPCPPTGQAYSEIKLKAECIGGTTVRLSLKNIGNAPTQGWHEYKIIRNDLVEFNNAFSLNAQESLSFDFPAEGATWRMEATKFDDGTQTAVAIENCGGLTPGLITAFWLDHGPVEYDFDCRQVVQAYDPNRKTAVPTGVGFENIISTGHPIYYTIDFQNTGTDTAFRVQLLDQLSENLDLNTFKAEGASHPCSWELRGSKLEVLYAPISLPDSNANLAASQGYFSYSISPKQNLQEGAQIYNFAQIVFDFNWPIWTNWVSHRIGSLTVSVDEAQAQTSAWRVLGNPTRDVAIFRTESLVAGENQFELFDASGRVLRSARFSGPEFEFRRDMLPEGLYFFRISDAEHRVFAGKVVIAE